MANVIQKAFQRVAFGTEFVEKALSDKDSFGGSKGLLETVPQSTLSGAPAPVNYHILWRIYIQETWVRAAVDVTRRTGTALGWELVPSEGIDDPDEEQKEVLLDFFDQPNPEDSMTEILDDMFTDIGIFANTFIEVVTDTDGMPRELWNIDATSIKIKHDEHGYITGYVQEINGRKVHFESDEIMHVRLVSKGASKYGLSPIESLISTVDTDLKAQIYTRKYYENYGAPKGLFKMKNATPEQVRRNRLYLQTQVAGIENAHRHLMLEGDVDYQPLGSEFKDTESLKVRKFLRDEIIAVYGVPPSKIAIIESGNIGGGTGKSQDRTFKEETVYPLQNKIANKVNLKIIRGLFGITDWKFQFVRENNEDELQKAKIHDIYVKDGIYTRDEIRADLGKKPLPPEVQPPNINPAGGGNPGTNPEEGSSLYSPHPGDRAPERPALTPSFDPKGKSLDQIAGHFANRMIEKNFVEFSDRLKTQQTDLERDFKTVLRRKINRAIDAIAKVQKSLSEDELNRLEASIQLIFSEEEIADNFEPSLGKMYESSWEAAQEALGVAANPVPDILKSIVRQEAILLAKSVGEAVKDKIIDTIINAQNNGEGIREMQDRIKGFLDNPLLVDVKSKYDASGQLLRAGYTRTVSIDKWATMIARTESSYMANKAIIDQYRGYGIEKVKWLTSSKPCPLCSPNNGRIYTLKEIDGLIPYHVNCVCSWVAEV